MPQQVTCVALRRRPAQVESCAVLVSTYIIHDYLDFLSVWPQRMSRHTELRSNWPRTWREQYPQLQITSFMCACVCAHSQATVSRLCVCVCMCVCVGCGMLKYWHLLEGELKSKRSSLLFCRSQHEKDFSIMFRALSI